jgi:ArsR family transcriptional regulator, arsenate/arsenite/antimonite-responsive transcriptional repressor
MEILQVSRMSRDLTAHAQMFHALSDERRLRILEALRGGELCVCDLQAELGMAQSLLSFHLKALRDAGLVHVRRSGRWAHYSINSEGLSHAAAAVDDLRSPTTPRGTAACCAGQTHASGGRPPRSGDPEPTSTSPTTRRVR